MADTPLFCHRLLQRYIARAMWDMAREAWEEVWEQVASCCCRQLGGVDDNDNDVRGDDQDILYVDGGSLSRNRQLAEGGEGDVDNYRRVRGLHRHRVDTGDRR